MTFKKSSKRTGERPLCADLHGDDGPQQRHRKHDRAPGSSDRKTMQLCAQVERALHGAIPMNASPHLVDAVIEVVEPAPDASRLRVVVSIPQEQASQEATFMAAQQNLGAMTPHLRASVAAQISRKRVPLLAFVIIAREVHP